MDQIQNGQSPEFLKHLLSNPAAAGSKNLQELENLVQTYPQCSVFHLLLAKAVQKSDVETAAKALQSAAVHAANREVLFKLIHQPELIIAPKQESVYPPVYVEQEEIVKPDAFFTDEKPVEENVFAEIYPVEIINTFFIDEKPSTKENEDILLKESYPEENLFEESDDTSFIDIKPVEEEEVISENNSSAENVDTSFIDTKPVKEVENVEDIPSAESDDTSFIGEKPVEEEEIIEEDIPSTENFDAYFIGEKPVEEEEIMEEDIPSQENVNASFTDEKFPEEGSFSEDHNSIDPNNEEDILIENDLRVEDVNLNFVNGPAKELVFPTEEATVEDQQQEKEEAIIEETGPEIAPVSAAQEIDEEVYDEITAIEDIHFEAVKTASPEETKTAAETKVEEQPTFTIQGKAEKDMLSSIASIDYFTFNNRFGQNHTSPVTAQKPVAEITAAAKAAEPEVIQAKSTNSPEEKEPETVSKYHDDKMPYTFMWWLDKTRKEHAGTYQPYVKSLNAEKSGQPDLGVGPELQQQYIESIFHDKPPLELTGNILPPVAEPAAKRKEDVLIERFIIEEPHIHPPSSEKLDTENKAKKSAEDADALVTETLAKIYLDQMLYHKALDTYQKLLLKFPEKSVYFAGQIELIEKKIN